MTTGTNLAVSGFGGPGQLAPVFSAALPPPSSNLAVNQPMAPASTSALPVAPPPAVTSIPPAASPTVADYVFSKAKPQKNIDPLTVQLLSQNGVQGLQFFTNKGNAARIKPKEVDEKGASGDPNMTGFVPLDPNAQYRIRNESGKDKILYTGTGEEGLRNVWAISQQLSAKMKKKANWGVEMQDPVTGTWRRVADDDPAKNVLGKIADIALPIAGALLAPLTGGASLLGTVGIGAAGAAAGSALSGAAQGRSLGSILKNAAIAGGLSYLGGSALQGLGGAGSAGSSAPGAASGSAGAGAGLSGSAGGLGAGVSGGASAAGAGVGNLASDVANQIVVTGVRGGGSALGGLAQAIGRGAAGAAGALGANAVSSSNGPPSQNGSDIEVIGHRPFNPNAFDPGVLVELGAGGLTAAQIAQLQSSLPNGGHGMSASDIANYLRLGSLGVGLVGSLFGGGSGGPGSATMPPNPGGAPWQANLPAPTMQPRVARNMPPQDWLRYGTRPEQSFFTNVPQGYTPPGPGINDDAWDHFAEGGLAVRGAGDGRADKIPALVSDGEYIVDAETVALLGNGSSKAGAKALDDLRVRVRQQKGKDLAVGKFTRPAKRPEQYLKVRHHA